MSYDAQKYALQILSPTRKRARAPLRERVVGKTDERRETRARGKLGLESGLPLYQFSSRPQRGPSTKAEHVDFIYCLLRLQ